MPRGRKLASLTLTDEQQNQLQGMAQSATLPYALVVRARIILASAEGLTNTAVAKRVGVIRTPSANGDDASARPACRGCTTKSGPDVPGPTTTTRWPV